MMGHSCNLSAQKADAGGLFKVKANLGYTAKLSIKKIDKLTDKKI